MVGGVGRQTVGFADDLEEGDGDEAPGGGDEGIAGFVPVGVVFSADNVKEVALAEGEFVRVVGRGLVIVESFDDLEGEVSVGEAETRGEASGPSWEARWPVRIWE